MKSSTPLFQGIMNAAATHSTKIKGVMKGLGLSGNSNSLPVDNTHTHSSSNNTSSLGAPEEGDTIRGSRQGTVSSIGQSVMGANRITPRPEEGGIPPVSDNVAGSLSGNEKAQSLGENLWEGEAFAQQRALKRQVGASPVPTPGSEFDAYGGMFSQPLAQSGEIKEANKQRRQDRRQRVKDIKIAGGPENYSADGYHVGEYDKKGRNIQYPEKRYSKKNPPTEGLSGADVMSMQFHGFTDLPDDTNNVRGKKIPLKQSGNLYAVNKEKTGTSKDTLHFGTNYTFKEGNILGVKTKHGVSEEFDKDATYVSGRGKGYIDDEAIRKTTKEAIAKGIYNLPKNNNMFNFSHLEKSGKAKYKK